MDNIVQNKNISLDDRFVFYFSTKMQKYFVANPTIKIMYKFENIKISIEKSYEEN